MYDFTEEKSVRKTQWFLSQEKLRKVSDHNLSLTLSEQGGKKGSGRPAVMSFLLRMRLAGSSCGKPGPGVSVAMNFREKLVEVCGQLAP